MHQFVEQLIPKLISNVIQLTRVNHSDCGQHFQLNSPLISLFTATNNSAVTVDLNQAVEPVVLTFKGVTDSSCSGSLFIRKCAQIFRQTFADVSAFL